MIEERDVEMPMRDGIVLRADVYRPDAPDPVPAVLNRTPYDRSMSLTPPAGLAPDVGVAAGLAVVVQDMRGRHSSDGDFDPFRSEGPDGYDSVEWVAAQPWCDGRVAMCGRSYSASAQWRAAAERPPHLTAIFPVVPASSSHAWTYPGGAFCLGFMLFWIKLLTRGARGGLADQYLHLPLVDPPLIQSSPLGALYRDLLAHEVEDDFWRSLDGLGHHDRVAVPAQIVAGWYDVFLKGTLESYSGIRGGTTSSEPARTGTRLLVGPWVHGSTYGAFPDTSFEVFAGQDGIDIDALQLAFFARTFAGGGPAPAAEAPVRIFVMGENRWRDEDDWPLARAEPTKWFLHSAGDAAAGGGSLSPDAPGEEPPDAYRYDPGDPAPTIGGPACLPGRRMKTNAGPLDQRPLEERPDVLVYTSAPLADPVEVTGPLVAVLFAATSGVDTDVVAKLCDVHPDGCSRILAEGVQRGRFTQGRDVARRLEPGRVYEYRVDLVATSNVFLAGHAIRLLVTSSSFPRFDRNTNTGNPLGEDGPDDLIVVDQTIHHDDGHASYVLLPVVPRAAGDEATGARETRSA